MRLLVASSKRLDTASDEPMDMDGRTTSAATPAAVTISEMRFRRHRLSTDLMESMSEFFTASQPWRFRP